MSIERIRNVDEIIVHDYEKVAQILAEFRSQNSGAKIVLTMGSFDMLHIGHMRYIRMARLQGDFLVVGIDSDEKVRARKGSHRPIYPEDERIEGIAHTQYASLVTVKQLQEPKWCLVKLVCPDVLIATESTYTPEQVEQLKQWCGQVKVLERQATTSTSNKIRNLFVTFGQQTLQELTDDFSEFEKKIEQNVGSIQAATAAFIQKIHESLKPKDDKR